MCGVVLAPMARAQVEPWHQAHPGNSPWKAPVAYSESFHIGTSKIEVNFGAGPMDLSHVQLMRWVKNAASAVATYYGQFPVPMDRIRIEPVRGSEGVLSGKTWGDVGGDPAFTLMRVGQNTTPAELNRDLKLTRQMVRTAFPVQAWTHRWIEDGLATYVAPIARVQAGLMPAKQLWGDMVQDMPRGYPPPGSKGLDHTHTWAQTYWGGAQFCLMGDVSMREMTHNQKGLQDALRAIVKAGGTINHRWPIHKVLKVGDAATGTHVLEGLYARMADHAVKVNLARVWKELGVQRTGNGVRFNSHAPAAAVRRAIDEAPEPGRITPRGFTPAPVTGARVQMAKDRMKR